MFSVEVILVTFLFALIRAQSLIHQTNRVLSYTHANSRPFVPHTSFTIRIEHLILARPIRAIRTLLCRIIYLHPIPVRVLEIDLFNPVHSFCHGARCAGPILISNPVFLQVDNELIDGSHREAEMSIFFMTEHVGRAADHVQMAFGPDAEPGMPAVVKRLGNSIEPDDIAVELRTFFQVHHIDGDMIESGHRFGLSMAKRRKDHAGQKGQRREVELFHIAIYGKTMIVMHDRRWPVDA